MGGETSEKVGQKPTPPLLKKSSLGRAPSNRDEPDQAGPAPDFAIMNFEVLGLSKFANQRAMSIKWLEAVGFEVVAFFSEQDNAYMPKAKAAARGINVCVRLGPELLARIQVLVDPTGAQARAAAHRQGGGGGGAAAAAGPAARAALAQTAARAVLERAGAARAVRYRRLALLHDPAALAALRSNWTSQGGLWRKDISLLQAYFGAHTAFYFDWLRHYCWYLLLASGVGVFFWNPSRFHMPKALDDWEDILSCAATCFGSLAFLEGWRRRQARLARRWGTTDAERNAKSEVLALRSAELCRLVLPSFEVLPPPMDDKEQYGDDARMGNVSVSSKGSPTKHKKTASAPISVPSSKQMDKKGTSSSSNSMERLTKSGSLGKVLAEDDQPLGRDTTTSGQATEDCDQVEDKWLGLRQTISYTVQIIFLVGSATTMFLLISWADRWQDEFTPQPFSLSLDWAQAAALHFAPMLTITITAVVLTQLHAFAARWLTSFEAAANATAQEQRAALLMKLFCFQCVNYFYAPLYVAFYLQDLDQLGTLLFAAMVTRQLVALAKESLLPAALGLFKKRVLKKKYAVELYNAHDPAGEYALKKRLDDELNMEQFDVDQEYMKLVIQFGFVVVFSGACRLASIAALLNNIFEFHLDSNKLLRASARPRAVAVADIAPWGLMMEVLGVVGVVSNCGLLLLTAPTLDAYVPEFLEVSRVDSHTWAIGTLLLLVIIEHVLVALRVFIQYTVPDVPKDVRMQIDDEMMRENHRVRLQALNDMSKQGVIISPDSFSGPASEWPSLEGKRRRKKSFIFF